jgi:IclR family KDG regulon transcriptional repressor
MKIVNKAISVLDLFLASNGELSVDEISRLAGMNKSTTRRIVLSLIECGFLQRQQRKGKYSLGMKFLDYIQAVKKNNPVIDIAEPYLNELQQIINETISLALWDGYYAIICRSIFPNHPLRVNSNEGALVGLHFASLGKAILAEMPEEELNRYISKSLTRYTHNTITDVNDLKKHLIIVRQEGAAIDDEEAFLGVRGIGAVLKNNESAVVGAVNVLGPSIRLTREKITEYIPAVKECALKISKALGYSEQP